MVINKDNILKALTEGITQEELAKQFAASLNEAAADYKQQQHEQKNKLHEAEMVAHFINSYYPNTISNTNLTAKDIIKIFDSYRDTIKLTSKALKTFF